MITPQGSRTGKGTISPSYELDDYQMKLAFHGQKNSDGTTGSKNFDLKFNGAEITWPVIYYMDRDHVHRLDDGKISHSLPSTGSGYGSECTSSYPCSVCEGDCDSDSDCFGSLRCWQRSGGRASNDCKGSMGPSGHDYCYDPIRHKELASA
jgi:hypothetical protein